MYHKNTWTNILLTSREPHPQGWSHFLREKSWHEVFNQRPRKAVLTVVYMQDRGFNSFISNMINLSVNETKWSSLLARTHALILYISIWMCVFGPEKLPRLWRNGPLGRIKWKPIPIPRKRQAARRQRRGIFPFLIWWMKDLLILRLFFPRLGTKLETLKDRHTAISRKVVGKSARDNPERYCGWFWVHRSSKKFERMAREAMDVCFRVLKESNKNRFDSYSVRNSVLIISQITFRNFRVHIFPTTFLKITVSSSSFIQGTGIIKLQNTGHLF